MQKFLRYFLLLAFFAGFSFANAQTSSTMLTPGDVSITGFNSGNGNIAFVSWVDLQPNTKINFTNNGWLSSATTTTANNARNVEEIAVWTNTTGKTITAGTTIVLSTAIPYAANYGSTTVISNSGVTNPSMKLQDGNQITVYQTKGTGTGFSPDNSGTATFSGTALCIVDWLNNWRTSGPITNATTYLPSDLAPNSTFLSTPYLNPYLQYSGTRTGKTILEYKTALQNVKVNWSNNWAAPMNSAVFDLGVRSANANLSNLTTSQGAITPGFLSSTTTYTSTVANNDTVITVTPTAEDATASISVNGKTIASGNASDSIVLKVGSNTIEIVVTAQNGSIKTYTLTVNRAANADLSDLTISQGTLSPAFDSATTNYSASVANTVTFLTVTPVASNQKATVSVNGKPVNSGTPTPPIPLNIGTNAISIIVTAEDATINTYTITVTRALRMLTGPNMTRSTDLGIDRKDNITSDVTPVFIGFADPNATVTLYDSNTVIGSGMADSSGNWTLRASALTNGTHAIKAIATLNGASSSSKVLSIITDNVPPGVDSVSRFKPDTATTSATTVTYRIAFSEKVGALTVSNFALTASGTAAGTIASVSSDTGTLINVTVNNITGQGTLRLDVKENTSIMDVAGNLIAGGFTTGEEYTITTPNVLPVTLTDFKASQKGSTVEVTWKAAAEVNVEKYEIERSSAGINFTKAGEIIIKANAITNIYTWTDTHPNNGNNFYRLKTIDKDGTAKYSEIRAINFSAALQYVKVTPNPVINKTLKLTLGNLNAGKYQLTLYDNKGQKVFGNSIVHDGRSFSTNLQLPPSLTPGVYTLQVTNESFKTNKAIIVE